MPVNQHRPGRRGRPPREEVYQRLDDRIQELWTRLGGLPHPIEASDIWRDIWFEEAHHSTAIEGNTLVRREVEALLAEGRAVGHKELREYMEVRGYATAAKWTYDQGVQPDRSSGHAAIAMNEVRHVHALVMTPVWDVARPESATDGERPGSFRRHDIEPFHGGMTPPSWISVDADMADWLASIAELSPGTSAFPEELARLHCRFEQIHPFLNGNGRAGRLILNLILVRMGYPPAIIYKRQRLEYLRALKRADAGEVGQLAELLARAVLDNLYKFVMPAVAGPARLVPIDALQSEEASAHALRVAARRGRLQATQGSDGKWLSCRNWVDAYLASRYRRSA